MSNLDVTVHTEASFSIFHVLKTKLKKMVINYSLTLGCEVKISLKQYYNVSMFWIIDLILHWRIYLCIFVTAIGFNCVIGISTRTAQSVSRLKYDFSVVFALKENMREF